MQIIVLSFPKKGDEHFCDWLYREREEKFENTRDRVSLLSLEKSNLHASPGPSLPVDLSDSIYMQINYNGKLTADLGG